MNKLYPLKFKPIYKDKIWGGQKIKTVLGKDFKPLPNCGEVWVLSGVDENQTEISEGFLEGNELNELVEIYMEELVGDSVYQKFGNEFPILIKFIDANDWLSIQVHPNDELAAKRHNSLGKTEMWYILDAEKDSELISGFSKEVDKETYKKHLENKTIKEIMNFSKVKKREVYYMPAGRVHALGPGILLAEIQQTSDITYRIYDWDRIDSAGLMRELHTEEALDAIDFKVYKEYKTPYKIKRNETVEVVESPYFTTNILQFDKPVKKDYTDLDSFVIYICTKGKVSIKTGENAYELGFGEAMLMPAVINDAEIHPIIKSTLLEVYMMMK
ncbi:MAG: class I mannose-6-phosphate isomerase [Bacteroidales bacterium]|nr:class I mannose-6-phosphate isomerase [Bacteroidales bacterium]MCF8403130.1 class I mannose-6-phosphate isomerase [Bacteroidales bacterium]